MSADDAPKAQEPTSSDLSSTFTNDSAMMIAYERSLETKLGDAALFQDSELSSVYHERIGLHDSITTVMYFY